MTELDLILEFMRDELNRAKDQRRPYWTVNIDGYSTHTGSANHNRALSAQRERVVQGYIQDPLSAYDLEGSVLPIVRFNPNFHGFDQTTVVGEDPKGRSVRVAVTPPGNSLRQSR